MVAVEGRRGARRLWGPLTSAAAAKPTELQWLAVLACWCARAVHPQQPYMRCLLPDWYETSRLVFWLMLGAGR